VIILRFKKATMGMFQEFKSFAMRGNVIDLAIGVVIGGAFGSIVTSFINDVLTPLILKPALDAAHLTNLKDLTIMGTVKYGSFLSALINFIIIAIVLFLIIKAINAAKKKEVEVPVPVESTAQEILLTEIRDLLKEKKV